MSFIHETLQNTRRLTWYWWLKQNQHSHAFPHGVSKWRKNKWCDNQIQTHFALKCICLGSINKWVPIARNMMKKMVCFITQVLCFLDCFFDASDVCVYMITIGKFMSINTPSHLCTSKLVFLGSTRRKAPDLISLSLPLSLFLVRPNWVRGLMPIGHEKKILRSTFLLCCFAIKKKKITILLSLVTRPYCFTNWF